MDYCSSCRRHLNGALVCPGCGAYAPDIAPFATGSTYSARPYSAANGSTVRNVTTPARSYDPPRAARSASASEYGDGLFDGAPQAGPDDAPEPEFHPSGDVADAPAASQGRAARRRQLARWKKNKRRAAVATAVALVGGGITMAAMERQSTDRTQAAAAPDNHSMGAAGEEATADTLPESTPPGTGAPAHPAGPAHARPHVPDTRHQQATVAAQSPRTAAAVSGANPSHPHTDAALPALPVQQHVLQQISTPASTTGSTAGSTTGSTAGSGGTAAGGGGTTASRPASAPASTGTGGTTSATPQTTGSTGNTGTAPAATSPAHLCLLGVLCL